MPNWCYNKLEVQPQDDTKEAKKQFSEFKKMLKANVKQQTISQAIFSKILPMPKELNITSGSETTFGIAVVLSTEQNDHEKLDKIWKYEWAEKFKTREELIAYLISGKFPPASVKKGKQALENMEKYGHADWYSWRNSNWGTKWDTSKVYVETLTKDGLVLTFDTAWGPALNVFTSVMEKFDKLFIEIEYEESGNGFEGTFTMEYGSFTNDEREYDYSKDEE